MPFFLANRLKQVLPCTYNVRLQCLCFPIPAEYLSYSAAGWFFDWYPASNSVTNLFRISGIRPDICPYIRHPAEYLSRYPASHRISNSVTNLFRISGNRFRNPVDLMSGPSLVPISPFTCQLPALRQSIINRISNSVTNLVRISGTRFRNSVDLIHPLLQYYHLHASYRRCGRV